MNVLVEHVRVTVFVDRLSMKVSNRVSNSEGYGTWFVSMSVCLLPRFLPLGATRQQKSDTNRFSAIIHWLYFKFGDFRGTIYCVRELWCENQVKNQYAN